MGIRQKEFGPLIGKSQTWVTNLETGTYKSIKPDTLIRMSKVLGIKQTEIVQFEDIEDRCGEFDIHMFLNSETYQNFRKAIVRAHTALNMASPTGDRMTMDDDEIDEIAGIYLASLYETYGYDLVEAKRKIRIASNADPIMIEQDKNKAPPVKL